MIFKEYLISESAEELEAILQSAADGGFDLEVMRDWLVEHGDPIGKMIDLMFGTKERKPGRGGIGTSVDIKMPRGSIKEVYMSFAKNNMNFYPQSIIGPAFLLDDNKFYLCKNGPPYITMETRVPAKGLPLVTQALQTWSITGEVKGRRIARQAGCEMFQWIGKDYREFGMSPTSRMQMARWGAYCRVWRYRQFAH